MKQSRYGALAFRVVIAGWLLGLGPIGCGDGSSKDTSPTDTSPPANGVEVSRVSIAPASPAFAAQAISEILSPSASGAPGGTLRAPTSTVTGQSIVFGLDAAGSVVLASIVVSDITTLSSDSTAHALARVSLRAPASPDEATRLDSAIRSAPAFDQLVNNINVALGAKVLPLESSAVLDSLILVISSASQTLQSALAAGRKSASIADMKVESSFPFTLFNDGGASSSKTIRILNDSLRVSIENKMPIPWEVRISPSNSVQRLAAEQTTEFQGRAEGFDISIFQSDETRTTTMRLAFANILAVALSTFVGGDTCIQNLASAVAGVSIPAASTGSMDDLYSSLSSFGTLTDVLGLAGCGSQTLARVAVQYAAIARRLSFSFASIGSIASLASNIPRLSYLRRYFDESKTFGVCVSGERIVNCAASFRFVSNDIQNGTILMAPESQTTVGIEGLDRYGALTPLPNTLTFQPLPPAAAVINPITHIISAISVDPSPVEVSVTDAWSGAEPGKVQVSVVWPRISPFPFAYTLTQGQSVAMSLRDQPGPEGRTVVLPPGAVMWKTREQGSASCTTPVGERLMPSIAGSFLFVVPNTAPEGFVDVCAYSSTGVLFDTATFYVPSNTVLEYSGATLRSSGTDINGVVSPPGPVSLMVVLNRALPPSFTGLLTEQDIAKVTYGSGGVGSFDRFPPFTADWTRIRLTNGVVTAWSFSMLGFETLEPCTCLISPLLPRVSGTYLVNIGSGLDLRFPGLDEGAFKRCQRPNRNNDGCTNYLNGGTGQTPGTWSVVQPAR